MRIPKQAHKWQAEEFYRGWTRETTANMENLRGAVTNHM